MDAVRSGATNRAPPRLRPRPEWSDVQVETRLSLRRGHWHMMTSGCHSRRGAAVSAVGGTIFCRHESSRLAGGDAEYVTNRLGWRAVDAEYVTNRLGWRAVTRSVSRIVLVGGR